MSRNATLTLLALTPDGSVDGKSRHMSYLAPSVGVDGSMFRMFVPTPTFPPVREPRLFCDEDKSFGSMVEASDVLVVKDLIVSDGVNEPPKFKASGSGVWSFSDDGSNGGTVNVVGAELATVTLSVVLFD